MTAAHAERPRRVVYAEVIMNILFLLLFLISVAFGALSEATADEGNGIDPHGG